MILTLDERQELEDQRKNHLILDQARYKFTLLYEIKALHQITNIKLTQSFNDPGHFNLISSAILQYENEMKMKWN